MTTTYQQRKESRIDYLRSKASKFSTMSDDALESSRAISNLIPFGQPILVGHKGLIPNTNDYPEKHIKPH